MLALRKHLSNKPDPLTLKGQYVYLEPLVIERDAEALYDISNGNAISLGKKSIDSYDADNLIWRYMVDGPFNTFLDFSYSLQAQVNASHGLCLCVFDLATKQPIGVANFMNNVPEHLKIELGGIWYSPIVQRTQANTETTYLMLKAAFKLGYRRLEWKCHSNNERSRKAALRMGFKFEGIQENHMIVKNCNRDTSWYRILDNEWPEVSRHLELLLYTDSNSLIH